MQQRVGLVRALPSDAGILLMDVAFSSLGPLIRKNMQDMLLALQEELNKTIVFITHDINEVLKIGAKSITPSWVIKIMEKEGFSDLYNEKNFNKKIKENGICNTKCGWYRKMAK